MANAAYILDYDLTKDTPYFALHCNDVTMCVMTSQITSNSTVYSTICSGQHQRNTEALPYWPFVRGIHRSPVNSPHKGPVTRKGFPWWRHHAHERVMECNSKYLGENYFFDYLGVVAITLAAATAMSISNNKAPTTQATMIIVVVLDFGAVSISLYPELW